MLDSGFMPPLHLCSSDRNVTGGGCAVATRDKNSGVVSKGTSICLHYTLCLMQLSVACNLIPRGVRMISRGWIISHRYIWIAGL